jgi:SAM-dependent methyltransferase
MEKGREGVGERYLRRFVELAGLAPDEAVLDVGCGAGRMAEPLSHYLTTGSYDGFDVILEAIESCERNIKHPNFRFRHVDLRNPVYNPEGRLDPERFEFPYPDESFDFAFLTSVFTHMPPPEVKHYLDELQRVLRSEGRCLMTFFLLNEHSLDAIRAGQAKRRFAYEGDGYRYDVAGKPERAIAYREEGVLRLFEQAGFRPHTIAYGAWAGRQAEHAQDVVVVKRP